MKAQLCLNNTRLMSRRVERFSVVWTILNDNHFIQAKRINSLMVSYIYTVFMRFREILEMQARKFKAEGNVLLERRFEEAKNNLIQIYNDSVY